VVQVVITSPASPEQFGGKKIEAAERRVATIQFMLGIHSRASSPDLHRFQSLTSKLNAVNSNIVALVDLHF
jgi:hypothetical protein